MLNLIYNDRKMIEKYTSEKSFIYIILLNYILFMVNYKCLRCGYSNNNRTIFINHLKRKFKCPPKIKDISTKEIYDRYFNLKCQDYIDDSKNTSTNVNTMSTNVNTMSTNVNKNIHK